MADSSITPIPASLNVNFTALYAAVNACINAIATEVVTANASAAGATTIGNGFVIGIFGATTLVGSTIRGGNSSAANTILLASNLTANQTGGPVTITVGNTLANATQVGANLFVGPWQPPGQLGNTWFYDLFVATSGTSAQLIDSFLFTQMRAADYLISVSDNNANNKMLAKLLVLQDGGAAYSVEYGDLVSNSLMGTFTANSNTTAVTLYFTPVSTSANVRITRISQVP